MYPRVLQLTFIDFLNVLVHFFICCSISQVYLVTFKIPFALILFFLFGFIFMSGEEDIRNFYNEHIELQKGTYILPKS